MTNNIIRKLSKYSSRFVIMDSSAYNLDDYTYISSQHAINIDSLFN